MKNIQTEAFGRKEGEWVWCLHCERCYQVGENRLEISGQEYCPYPNCDGDTMFDSWLWKEIKEKHPDYPEIPERDKIYPLYKG